MIKPAVRSMPAYQREEAPAPRPTREIRLDWNESAYGPSPKARAAIAAFDGFHRYPPIDAAPLREALGRYIGAPAETVICGAGLDDVLNTLAMTLLEPGDRVLISEPTFGVYRPLFSGHGAEVVDVPLAPGWALDPEALLSAADDRTKLIVVCNPNNPTGTLFAPAAVERVCAEAPTMSKFAGLAGMRIGYGVFPESLVGYALRVMPAFANVGAAAAAAAIASLDDLPYLDGVIARIVTDREELASRLREIPSVEPVESATNFLLVRLPVDNAGPIVAGLGRRGVFVRHFGRPDLGLRPYLRVSLGTPEENAIFAAELEAILGEAAA
jgi:histidinol-phosphate aminotransferase